MKLEDHYSVRRAYHWTVIDDSVDDDDEDNSSHSRDFIEEFPASCIWRWWSNQI
jgi:hypothetical protein